MKKFPALTILLLAFFFIRDADAQPENQIELGYSHDMLDKGYPDWNSTYLDLAHQFGERHTFYAELREVSRYNMADTELSGGYYYPLSETWTGLVEASASPTHHVLAKGMLSGRLQKSFGNGWDVQAGLRRSLYDTTSANLTQLIAERYWDDFRAAYNLYLNKLPGAATASNHQVQLSYYYGETGRSYLTLGASQGRLVESLGGNAGVLLSDVRGAGLYGRHWLNGAWAVSYEASTERLDNLYTRKGIRLGLRRAF